ncbi:MAG: hypothetical protein CVV44_11140 [Spirochaetae bacterium HGW-Spirochaetae-1]|jgi:hypothetical protein|nr:MAG: hypothetical protein CVV44_11140 [Spirochaetae bacterium HGW-Spirochaetae-1]
MSKEELEGAIYETIEYLTKYELSPTAQKLIRFYFNESTGDSSYLRALDAIERYFPESLPPVEEQSPRLQKLLETLKLEADRWDLE